MNTYHQLEADAQRAADFLKVLANPDRLTVVCALIDGEQCVGDLIKHTSLSQSAFSQHLAVLRREGIVATRKQAQSVLYRLANDDVKTVLNALRSVMCRAPKL